MLFFSIGLSGMDYRITGTVYEDEPQEIESLLKDIETEFLPRFKLDGNYRLSVHVCKGLREFLRLTGVSWWNGGHFRERTIYLQRLAVLRERVILPQTLTHEFLHFCIWRTAGNNCPVWLNEGLVMNLSGEAQVLDCFNKETAATFPVEELDRLLRGKDYEKAKNAYCLAASVVNRLLKKVGFEKIRLALASIKAGNRKPLRELLIYLHSRKLKPVTSPRFIFNTHKAGFTANPGSISKRLYFKK